MKTYSESQNKKPFDWNKVLSAEPTEEQWEEMRGLAQNWITCACGNQCDIIPRRKNGRPKDIELFWLGLDFLYYISMYDLKSAKQTLSKIEERSAYLINKMEG